VISELRDRISIQEPALTIEFVQRIADLLGDLIGRPEPIEIKIFGDDKAILETLAKRAQGLLEKVRGMADLKNVIIVEGPTISIIPDEAKLAQFHLTAADLQTQLKAYNEGVKVGEVQSGGQMLHILLGFQVSRKIYLKRYFPSPFSRRMVHFGD